MKEIELKEAERAIKKDEISKSEGKM